VDRALQCVNIRFNEDKLYKAVRCTVRGRPTSATYDQYDRPTVVVEKNGENT